MNDEDTQELFDSWEEDFRARLPLHMRGCTLENFDAGAKKALIKAKEAVVEWCDSVGPISPGLFLTGPVGTGKTHLAIGAACDVIRARGWVVQYIAVQKYLERLRDSFDGDSECKRPRTVISERTKLVVFDDVGVEKPSEWVREQTFALVDSAYLAEIIVIATSNYDYAELLKPELLGNRTTSRLIEMTDKVDVVADDYRATRHKRRKA